MATTKKRISGFYIFLIIIAIIVLVLVSVLIAKYYGVQIGKGNNLKQSEKSTNPPSNLGNVNIGIVRPSDNTLETVGG